MKMGSIDGNRDEDMKVLIEVRLIERVREWKYWKEKVYA